jgi:hypothetical protein
MRIEQLYEELGRAMSKDFAAELATIERAQKELDEAQEAYQSLRTNTAIRIATLDKAIKLAQAGMDPLQAKLTADTDAPIEHSALYDNGLRTTRNGATLAATQKAHALAIRDMAKVFQSMKA